MVDIVSHEHLMIARKIKRLIALYNENEDFLITGNYQEGINQELDQAIRHLPSIISFLQQDLSQIESIESTYKKLKELYNLTTTKKKITIGKKS